MLKSKKIYDIVLFVKKMYGEVSEWFKELVLKASDVVSHRGFESHPLRHKPR